MNHHKSVIARTPLGPLAVLLVIAITWGGVALVRGRPPLWRVVVNPGLTGACLLMLAELRRSRNRERPERERGAARSRREQRR